MVLENQFCTLLLLVHPQVGKIYNEPSVELSKKINKPVLSHITFYLEDDEYKPVDFNS